MLVLTVSLLGAGCSSKQAAPQAPPQPSSPQSASSAAAASSTTPRLNKYPKARLAQKPCLSLDERDRAALGITGKGKEEATKHGPSCVWKIEGQNVSLQLDLPVSHAQTLTKGGRVSQVPVGQHQAVQAEFQRICFIFVAVDKLDNLIGATSIPEPGASQEGTCPAGASVVAAALTHIQ